MWKIVGASARGDAHIKSDMPCQDHHHYQIRNNILVAIVCDGAGSAKNAEIGARMGSEHLTNALISALNESTTDYLLNESDFRKLIESKLSILRANVTQEATINQLSIYDYHATLVGLAIGPEGGFFFHIGDGAAIALNHDRISTVAHSAPENGEFADQTYFYTIDDWQNHLRITPIGKEANIILLMSDGTMPFCLNKSHNAVEPKFFQPLDNYLLQKEINSETGSQALLKTLSSDRANLISKDDKTLIWASFECEPIQVTQ